MKEGNIYVAGQKVKLQYNLETLMVIILSKFRDNAVL